MNLFNRALPLITHRKAQIKDSHYAVVASLLARTTSNPKFWQWGTPDLRLVSLQELIYS